MNQSHHILLLDDNLHDRELIKVELWRAFAKATITDVFDQEDLDRVLARHTVDAVLTDYRLDWVDGLDVVQQVKTRYPHCVVIMFTGAGNEEIAVTALQQGVDDYVVKAPQNYARLPVVVRGALGRATLRRQAEQFEIERAELLERERCARVEAERSAARLARLQAVTASLAAAHTPAEVAEMVVSHGVTALGARAGSLSLVSEDGTMLHVVGAVGYPKETLDPWRQFPINAPVPLADAVRERRSIILPSLAVFEQCYPQLAARSTTRTDAARAAIPLVLDERVLGVIGLNFAHEQVFDGQAIAFMQNLAQQCAQVLERTRAEAERAQLLANEQAARQEAEEAVLQRDQFLSIASHELRTPLTSLIGYLELLQRRLTHSVQLEERDQKALRVVREQARRLNTMIGTLLDISRIQNGQLVLDRHPIDLAALVWRVVEELRPTLNGHAMDLYEAHAPVQIVGDELRLEQVLQNLLQNAVKYSRADGRTTVQLTQRDGVAQLTVRDQGIGIPAAALPHLFNRFYRAGNVIPEKISGFGIGLFVVKEIVTLHGGTVEVESTEGEGSVFVVTLPLQR